MAKCKCDMRTKLVGDGCEVCNPTLALEYAKETIDSLRQQNEKMANAIRQTIKENLHLADGDVCTLKVLKDALSEHDKANGSDNESI